MTVAGISRIVAIGIAAIGVIDPPWRVHRRPPVPVEISGDDQSGLSEARHELGRRLGRAITFESPSEPVALVLVGGGHAAASINRDGVPMSTVATTAGSPNVRIVKAEDPAPVRAGWSATVEATVEARGLAGTSSAIVLETRSAELSRVVHAWKNDVERYTATLRYTPPREGSAIVTVRAIPIDGETSPSDNAADLRLVVTGRRLKILVHEPRPSWNATFVRRALEDDQTFEVSTFVQASKGLAVRAGSPPPVVTADALTTFDAVVVGAPEELRPAEVDALRLFARRRGGAVILVPDRRPTGRYLELMPAAQFDEALVEDAVELRSAAGGSLRASEMALYRSRGSATYDVLASVDQGKVARGVVLEWLSGEGRILFSGALDAWRYRGAGDEGFSRFWRARVAEAAQAAPGRLAVSISPGAPAVGDDVAVRVRLRPTELHVEGTETRVPGVRARLMDAAGREQVVRLWPASEAGAFTGHVRFNAAGDFDLQVTTDAGVVVDEAIIVAAGARHAGESGERAADALRLVAAATGGVAVGPSDLGPLERHLRSLSTGEVESTVHPWRSPWLVAAFVALLAVEWMMRRRRGHP